MNFSFSIPLRRSAPRRSPAAPSDLSRSLRFAWVLLVAAFLPVASAGTITGTVGATQGNVPGATISLSRSSISSVSQLPSDNSYDYSGYYTYLDIASTSGNMFSAVNAGVPVDNIGGVFYSSFQNYYTGTFRFYLNSDDGSKLYVDDVLVVNNDGLHGETVVVREVWLLGVESGGGNHSVRIEFFESGGAGALSVSFEKIDGSRTFGKRLFGGDVLFNGAGGSSGNYYASGWSAYLYNIPTSSLSAGTAAGGAYSFSSISLKQPVILTPSYPGGTFDPTSRSVSGAGPHNFTLTSSPPAISDIADQTISEDGFADVTFTVSDFQTSAGSLTVGVASSNPALIPAANVTLSGTTGSRSARIVPLPNQNGTATLTFTVTDAENKTATDSFVVTVNAVNDPPVAGLLTALQLNGTSQYVQVPAGVWFGATFSVEGWVYPRSHKSWARMFDFGNGAGIDNVLGALSDATTGKPVLAIHQNGVEQRVTSSQALALNTWSHLAFTRDGAGVGHIYINGVETGSGTIWAPLNVTRSLNYLGRSNWAADGYADANLADLRIWSSARSAQEVAANRSASVSPATQFLQLNYRFNEGSGNLVTDRASSAANPAQGGAQNGALPNGGTFLNAGILPANSIQFSLASNQKVVVPNFGAQLSDYPITIEFWQKIDAQVSQATFVLQNTSGNIINAHVPWSDGKVYWDFGNQISGRLSYTPPVSPVGQWTHWALVSDFGPLQMKIYRNGVLEASQASASAFSGAKNGDLEIRPGGRLADFRVWKTARTAGEIASNYLAPVAADSSGLLLNFLFTETSGTTVADRATLSGAQNGNLVNGPVLNPAPTPIEGLASQMLTAVTEDSSQLVNLPAGDVDSALTYSSIFASNGTLDALGGGDYLYTPVAGFSGNDAIGYTVSDGALTSAGVVKVQVNAVNDPPVVGPGTALGFDGINDGVTLAMTGELKGTYTVEAWVRPDSTGTSTVMSSREPLESSFDFKFSGGNKIHADIGNGTSWINTSADANLNYTPGTWYHVAYVVTPATYTIYVNGVQAGTGPSGPGAVLYDANHRLRIGNYNGSGEFFDGRIGEVRIWNTARTAAQIGDNLGPALSDTASGLVARYRFNEGSGLTAFDSATGDGAQNGTLVGGTSWQPFEGPDTSLSFNGTTQYGQVLDSAAISITGAITLEAWIRPSSIGSVMGIMEKYGVGDGGYALRLDAGGRVQGLILDNSASPANWTTITGRTVLRPSIWSHVAATWDGALLRVFVNGVLDGYGLVGRSLKDGATPLVIGAIGDTSISGYRFNGRIGDVRLWNVARSGADIAAYRGGVPAAAPGLVLNYKFTEGSGATLGDVATGDGTQNGSLVGSPVWPAAEGSLAKLQLVRYTEDVPVQFVLPAFDLEGGTLTYSAVSPSSGSVAPVSGKLFTYTPAANSNGAVTITYTVSDGTTPVTGRVYLQGIAVEDGPTIAPIADQTIGEGSGTATLGIAITDGDPELTQGLSVTATSSNPNLVRNPGVIYSSPAESAQLTYKPRPGASGVVVIKVVVTDLVSNLTATNAFALTVMAVDDPPNVGGATSLAFNGGNYVNIPGFGPNVPLDEVTIEFWQKAVASAQAQSSFQLVPDDLGNRLNAHVPFSSSDSKVYWDFGNIGSGGRLSYAPPVPVVGSWQHFAFVASRSGNYMKIFRNGVEEASKPGVSTLVPGLRDLKLGGLNGQLAEFRVWKVARTAEQIEANRHVSLANTTTGLVAYYRFNQKPTTVLTDFASAAAQGGSQDGVLVADNADNDPIWNTPLTGSTGNLAALSWQVADPDLKALQVVRIPDGTSTNLFLPAWDAEDGLSLTWQSVNASTGSVAQVTGGTWTYTAPAGYDGTATINYSVRDPANHVTSGSVNVRVVIAANDPPTLSVVPNKAAEEDSVLIEIPFTVGDDQPASALTITPQALVNAELLQSFSVPPGGNYRTLNIVPKPGVIGTVHLRLNVQDAGGKTAQTEFDLRIEPKPAFSVVDLGVLPGKSASFGTAVNDRGTVAGYMADDLDLESNPVGFLFNGLANGGLLSQVGPSPLASPFRVFGLNNGNSLAGAGKNGGQTLPWTKDHEGSVTSAGLPLGWTYAAIRALNDTGLMTGVGTNASGKSRAFTYSAGNAAITDLGVAPAPFDDQSEAFALNISNRYVGAISATDGRRRAMMVKDGVMRPLFNVPDDTNSVANGINAFDQVVGRATTFAAGDTALNLDGVDDVLAQANLLTNPTGTPLVAGNAAHTVEAWIKVGALPGNRSWPLLLGNFGAGAHHWLVNKASSGGDLYVGIFNSAGVSVPVTVGTWMHVAATYDPPTSKLVVYRNGLPYGTNTVAGVNLQGIPLALGAANGEDRFNGGLDEVRIWRTTRTAAQIAAGYTQRLSGAETGLVAYYPFDEASGATTTSQATGGLVATLTGNPVRTVRGGLPAPALTVSEPALQFDGASSQVTLPAYPLANSSFSLEFWARRAEIGAVDYVMGQGSTGATDRALHVGFRPENRFTFAFYGDDLDSPVYTDTDWHHWACTFDSGTKAQKIYRDGVEVASRTATANFQGTGPVVLGLAPGIAGSWFKGAVDDVRVWSRVRTATEIAAEKDTRLPSNTPALIGNFLFDEGGGNTTVNRSTGASDGSLQGAIGWTGRDSGTSRAFLYDGPSGRLTSLGTVAGGGSSVATGINDFGQVVGTAVKGNGQRAFFYSAGKLNDLNDLLPEIEQLDQWTLQSAAGINRSGAIVGTGTHAGLKRAFLALPATVIGRPVIRPQGAVERYPTITILKKHRDDDTILNSFYWSAAESRLYAIRPVTAKIEWFTSFDDTVGTGTNLTANIERVVSVTVNVWPKQPVIHIAGAPVDLQPVVTAARYTFQNLIYVTNRASVEPSAKVFTSPEPGYCVAYYLKTDGLSVSASQPPYFEVIRTVAHDDSHAGRTTADCTIGTEVVDPAHAEYDGKNGYVLFEKAAYDAVGSDRAYDRGTRLGPILPVNVRKPGGNLAANPDDLLVVWYRTNRIGVAWASVPVLYSPRWPADSAAEKIIIASQLGSGYLTDAVYPSKTIYNQPDIALPGFNPNEEHAYMPENVLFAIRDDLNEVRNYSEPYALLKFRDPGTSRWRMKVFKVVAEQAPYFFTYAGTVGKEVQPPLPLSLMPLVADSYQEPAASRVGWKDYKGKFYARQAGPEGTHTNLMIRWFYPMQPGFFHPDNVPVGDKVAWLDKRSAAKLRAPNHAIGTPGRPIAVTYDIRWDAVATLQNGETLLHSKRGMPDVFNMANAKVIFDSLTGPVSGGTNILARFYDPISARTVKTGVAIPAALKRQSIAGKDFFTDLPWFLKIRLSHDPVNNWLSFSGHLDENFGVGEPLLLPNVLSGRERDRLKALAAGDGAWATLIDRLYDLTRNPNELDMDPFDGLADQALRLGLTREVVTNFFEIKGTNKTVVFHPSVDDSFYFDGQYFERITPAYNTTNYDAVTYYPTTVESAQQLDRRLSSEFAAKTFITATGVAPTSSYSITIGPTTTTETGPKALTAGMGGVIASQPKPGNALSFDGTSGRVTVGANLDLSGTPFTIEFWAKPTAPATEQYLVGQPMGGADLGRLRLGFRDGGKFAFDLGTTPASVSIFNTGDTYTDTGWHHWAGTFDPETKIQRIYRDGLPVGSRTNLALNYVGFGALELGRFGTQYFAGQLDEFRVWKTARTGSEIRSQMNKRMLGSGVEPGLEILYRCDEATGPLASDASAVQDGYVGTLSGGVSLVPSTAPAGIPPRYITIAENNDPALGGLPVALHVIRVDDGPYLGDLKVLPGDNVFDERLTMRHSSDFGGDPGPVTFQWYYKPIGADFDPTDLPVVTDPTSQSPSDMRGWTPYTSYIPLNGAGVNYITTGEGGESGLITLSDNAFICRYKGYAVNLASAAAWSGWVGDPAGTPDQPRAALAEGWVKRVIRGLNPFDARTSDFHSSPAVTFASMLIQAGHRYEGPIAFNPSADAINKVGLIEAYTTVLERAKGLSIEGVPQVDFNPANNALLLAATKIADFYMLLGNEAYADASDPTIGFGSGSKDYGSLASSIFAFQNQLDSLLEEELVLLRGRDDSAAGVGANPVYNRLFWNFTLGEGEVAYQQNYNISDQDLNGFIDEKDARMLYPQGHGDAWGHYLEAIKQHYELLKHPYFTWIPRTELVSVGGAAIKVDFLDERKFAAMAAAKAKAGAEIVDLTYRLNYVDDPAGQWQGYKDAKTDRAWGVTEWSRRAGMGAYLDWLTANTILPSEDPNPAHTGIDKIDRQTVREIQEIPAQFTEIQTRLDQADAGLNPLGLAKGVVPFDIDPSLVAGAAGIAGKTHYEQIQDRALKAMRNSLSVWDEVNKSTEALRRNQDTVEQLTQNVNDQERDYKNRLIEIFGYPHAGDIGAGKTYPSSYDGPDIYHYMYVPVKDLTGALVPDGQTATAYYTRMNLGIDIEGDTQAGAFGSANQQFYFPEDFAADLVRTNGAVLEVTYPQVTSGYKFSTPATWGARRAPGEIQLALSDLIQNETRLRASLKSEDALLADIDDKVKLLTARYDLRASELQIKAELANKKISLVATILALKIAQGVANGAGEISFQFSDAIAEALPKVLGLANDATAPARGAIKSAGTIVKSTAFTVAAIAGASADVVDKIGLPLAEAVATSSIDRVNFTYEVRKQVDELERVLRQVGVARLETLRLTEVANQSSGRYLAALAKGQRLIEERVAFRVRTAARTTENRYQDMTFRIFRNDALQKYRATFDLAQRYVFLAATAYDYESNLLGTDTRGGRAFLTDIIRQRSIGQMLDGSPVIGRSGLADPLARMGNNFDVLKTQLGFNNPQTETGRFSVRNELLRLRDSSDADWRANLMSKRVANLWDIPEFRRYCRSFAPESAGAQPGIVIRFPTTVTAGQNFFGKPLGGGDSAYDPSRFATKVRSAGVWFTGYNGLGLSQTPRVYLVPAGADVLSSPTPNDFVTRGWRVVDQALPVPFPIGGNRLSDAAWIPVNDSLGGSFAEVRRFSSFRAYHDSGGFDPKEATSDSRLIGRSVWNTDWMLIIPGQTFLANPATGLDTFINSVSDIKLFFQTYSYSGN